MTKKEEWLALFEKITGRKPSEKEIEAGQETDFDPQELITIASIKKKKKWSIPAISWTKKSVMTSILPIAIVCLALLFTILAWLTSASGSFLFLTVLLLIAGVTLTIINWKQLRAWSLASAIVAALSFALSLGAVSYHFLISEVTSLVNYDGSDSTSILDDEIQGNARDEDGSYQDDYDSSYDYDYDYDDDSSDSSDSSGSLSDDYVTNYYDFNWTEDKFRQLVVGQDSLDDIVKKFGKGSSGVVDGDTIELKYEDSDSTFDDDLIPDSVEMTFEEDSSGDYILESASFYGDVEGITESVLENSAWTDEQLAALKAANGVESELTKSTKLTDIVKSHPKASLGQTTLSTDEKGKFYQTATLYYISTSDDSTSYSSLALAFNYDSASKTYYLEKVTDID
ncbi:hypothetical protein [Streptococcus loxodontisalivarius]|uniref:MFS transporter n=1 Tax=Streptococcus loxodontisalivarius TaxID=1349415 RepID=A0ABS2PSP2_9STRE|nr:hypothetical protein [Streptococcus loxodontisalivarius]MBM7643066.1 hypothetical protein [Streptococcus loxodontisalivarius]